MQTNKSFVLEQCCSMNTQWLSWMYNMSFVLKLYSFIIFKIQNTWKVSKIMNKLICLNSVWKWTFDVQFDCIRKPNLLYLHNQRAHLEAFIYIKHPYVCMSFAHFQHSKYIKWVYAKLKHKINNGQLDIQYI